MTTEFRPERVFLVDPISNDLAKRFIQIEQGMAQGQDDFDIEGTSAPANVALERKQWEDLLNLFTGLTPTFQQLYGNPPDIAYIAEQLLIRAFGIHNPETVLPFLAQRGKPTPIPEEIMAQMTGQKGAKNPLAGGGIVGAAEEIGPADRSQFQQGTTTETGTNGNVSRVDLPEG